jgi:hypothetical protein
VRRIRRLALIMPVVLGLTPAATSSASSGAQAPPLAAAHARYVVLGQVPGGSTVALARVILDPGLPCPAIVPAGGGEDGASTTSSGAPPEAAVLIAMTPRDNPYHFPVQVCEAVIGFDRELVIAMDGGTLPLPAVRRDPRRIAVFGDTGCKLGAAADGACPAGSPAEPFARLASAAAAARPDLVIHLGDYNYRGTPSKVLFTERDGASAKQVGQWVYDAGDGTDESERCVQVAGSGFYSQSAPGSAVPDTWQAWNDDLFSAAAELLAAAPWAVARGNHELCSKAGLGWFYFLDPHSDLVPGDDQLSCPPPDPAKAPIDNVVLTPPYALDLGSLTLLMVDSANACDSFTEESFTAAYRRQLTEVGRLAPAAGRTWWVSHRPLWGVTGFEAGESTGCTDAGGSGEDDYGCINQTLQAALSRGLGGELPPAVELVLAGHMHRFQAITFGPSEADTEAPRPPVVVIGTGGVELDPSPPVGAFATEVGGRAAKVLVTGAEVGTPEGGKAAFGYLEVVLDGAGEGWSGRLIDPAEGLTLATCGSPGEGGRDAVCTLAPGVTAE